MWFPYNFIKNRKLCMVGDELYDLETKPYNFTYCNDCVPDMSNTIGCGIGIGCYLGCY